MFGQESKVLLMLLSDDDDDDYDATFKGENIFPRKVRGFTVNVDFVVVTVIVATRELNFWQKMI